ncbi:MAG: hypothetical protein Q7O66_23465 [Dehalococcoidia bacterium]|nr:hypothetical protein [Dehalococcoidia bacterium]
MAVKSMVADFCNMMVWRAAPEMETLIPANGVASLIEENGLGVQKRITPRQASLLSQA